MTKLTRAERWPWSNEFRLWPWQLKKCSVLTAILGVPILRRKGEGPWKAVGVICLDSYTEDGAKLIVGNEKELADYLTDEGKLLAWLN